jgi:hypothetical protein
MPEIDKKELWLSLDSYNFNHIVPPNVWNRITELFGGEDASTRAFADKIKRKHNWSADFSLHAIHEYKKFVYLGIISSFQVTPSKIIDIVWHEHLLFTKPYRQFCDEVIRYNFDHHPELMPFDDQTEAYAEQYIKTLLLYRSEFGFDAPVEIWDLPKFSDVQLNAAKKAYQRQLTTVYSDGGNLSYGNDVPLSSYFDDPHFSDFEGGDFGGGGAGGDFGNASDGGDSGGSSCGSSCSSGCSGGD